MIASPPMDTAVDCPRPAAVSVLDISVVMPPEREMTPTGPGEYALAASLAGPPMPPILMTSGTMIPRQLGPMMRAPRRLASSTICATSRRGMRSVTMTMVLMPFSMASKTASFVNAGGNPRALAVVQALAREVDRLAPGDALDDERRARVDEDAHAATPPWIFS